MAFAFRSFVRFPQLVFYTPVVLSRLYSSQFTRLPLLLNYQKCKTNYAQLQFIHLNIFTSMSKSQKGKSSKKYRVVIRPVDAEHIVDLIDVENQMKNEILELRGAYVKEFRVGADLNIFQNIKIDMEGDDYYLNEVARVTKKSPKLITIDMVDFPECIKTAQKAITESKLNLNPSVKGTIISVPIPQVTNEHRKAVARLAKQRMLSCKEGIRRIKTDTESEVKDHNQNTQDFEKTVSNQLKIYCEHYFEQADAIYSGKEKEILKPS